MAKPQNINQWFQGQQYSMTPGSGRRINPNDSQWFGTGGMSEGRDPFTLGDGTGAGFLDWSQIPGSNAFYTGFQQNGDSSEDPRINRNALNNWLQSNNYRIREADLQGKGLKDGGWARWIQDAQGNLVGTPSLIKNTSTSDLKNVAGVLAAAGAGMYANGGLYGNGMGDLLNFSGGMPGGGSPFEFPGMGGENGFSFLNAGAEGAGAGAGGGLPSSLYDMGGGLGGGGGFGAGGLDAGFGGFGIPAGGGGGGGMWENFFSGLTGGDGGGGFLGSLGKGLANGAGNMLSAALLQRLAGGSPPSYDFNGLAQQQNQMNRMDTTTPYGSVKYGRVADPNAPGGYRYTQDVSFSPGQQKLYDSELRNQQGMQNLAGQLQGRVGQSLSQPFNFDNIPGLQRIKGDFDVSGLKRPEARDLGTAADYAGGGDKVRDSIMQQFELLNGQRMQDEQDRNDAKLRNQGLMPGTEAYDRGMKALLDSQGQSRNDAAFRAIQAGGAEQSRLAGLDLALDNQRFGQQQTNFTNRLQQIRESLQNQIGQAGFNNGARNQSIQDMLLQRQLPLQEFNSLRTGNTPTLPSFQQPGMADLLGGARSQYGADVDAYNRRIGNFQQLLNLGTGSMLPYFGTGG